jgi:Transposase IS116/IS110/IS902 family
VEHAEARITRLDLAIEEAVKSTPPKMRAVIEALQALRGIAQVAAVTIVVELGEVSRFTWARQLMGYGGIVASEHSSGESSWRGGITKTGNAHVRRGRGGSLGVPPPAKRRKNFTQAAIVGQRRSPRDRLESAASVAYALSEADGTGQGKGEGCNRDRTRAIGFYLGHWSKSRGGAEGDRTAGGIGKFFLQQEFSRRQRG